MNTVSKVIIGIGLALILGYFGWQKLSETAPTERKAPEIALATEAPLTPTTSVPVMDQIWNWGVGVISMPWWKEMIPLWIAIGVLLILLFLFWLIGKDNFGKLIVRIIGLAAIVLAIWFVLNLWNGLVRMLPSNTSHTVGSSSSNPSSVQPQGIVNEFIVPGNSKEEWIVIDVTVWKDTVPESGKTVIVYAQSRPGEAPPKLRDVYSGNVAGRVTYLTNATTSELSPWRDGKIFLISADPHEPVKVWCTRW